jgi:hypothetical protein
LEYLDEAQAFFVAGMRQLLLEWRSRRGVIAPTD